MRAGWSGMIEVLLAAARLWPVGLLPLLGWLTYRCVCKG